MSEPSRTPRWLAWALACGTFPLIWMGGLVTTYGAGMAVPDWPNTFGYNLFLYPLESWIRVFDVFLEHSHRLIASAVGMITLALAWALWRCEPRAWLRWLGLVAVVAVIAQGVLGGVRVLGQEVFLAKLHGCTAPVFFSLTTAMVAFLSVPWQAEQPAAAPVGRLRGFAWTVTVLVYIQIVLGANVRHLPPTNPPVWFQLYVWLHLIVVGLLLIGIVTLAALVGRRVKASPGNGRIVVRRARWLLVLFFIQGTLGLFTWLVRYGVPNWFATYVYPLDYTVAAGSLLQATVVTAHVAVGSLTLVAAQSLALWLGRLDRGAAA